MKILLLALLAPYALADTPPVPKMFKGMQGQKGQYQVEILEAPGRAGAPQKMTICTDNLLKPQAGARPRGADSRCQHRLLKDSADEAVIETTCDGRTSKVSVKREGANRMLMSMESSGPRGPQTVKMRYTHLGACRAGQGTVTLDPDSEQCRKIRAQAAKMKDRESAARLSAMCN